MRSIRLFILPMFFTFFCTKCTRSQTGAESIDAYLTAWHASSRFNGSVLVAEKERVLYEKGFGFADLDYRIENRPDTRYNIGSISKQFTTVIVFQLAAEGLIKLDDTICDYLPDYRPDTGHKITVDHLLRQTSGLPCYLQDYQPQAGDDLRLPFPGWTHFQRDQLVREHLSGDLKFPPGSRYNYSNTNFFLLYLIIEKVTGKSLGHNYRERILGPLGMNKSGLLDDYGIVENRASGYNKTPLGFLKAKYTYAPNMYGAGSMFSTVEDLFLWSRALHSHTILPQSWQEKMVTPYISEGRYVKHAYSVDYYSMRLPNKSEPVEFSSFNGACPGFIVDVFTFPETDHTIVLFDNSEQFNHTRIATDIYKILQGASVEMPRPLAADVLGKTAAEHGVTKALEFYRELKANHREEYDFDGTANILSDQAYLLADAGRIDAATTILTLIVALNPNLPEAYRALGKIYERSGRPTLAQDVRKKAADVEERERQLYSHLKKGEFEEARMMIERIQSETPCDALFAPSMIGFLYDEAFQEQRIADAVQICRLWILGNPEDVGPYFSLARIYQRTGQNDEARKCYETVLHMNPTGRHATTARMRLEELQK